VAVILPGEVQMTKCFVLLASAAVLLSSPAFAAGARDSVRLAQAQPSAACPQVISCGTKNGVRKEYPTPCAARDDGATDIRPRQGATCEALK
jgi:hypothetical protein